MSRRNGGGDSATLPWVLVVFLLIAIVVDNPLLFNKGNSHLQVISPYVFKSFIIIMTAGGENPIKFFVVMIPFGFWIFSGLRSSGRVRAE